MAKSAYDRLRHACMLAAGACILLPLGCSSLSQPEGSGPEIPAARLAPDVVVLEVTTITAPVDIARFEPLIWEHVDEQHLPLDLRGRLSENGIRCGLLGPQLPAEVSRLFGENQSQSGGGAAAALGEQTIAVPLAESQDGPRRKRLRNRAGGRGIIVLGGRSGELSILLKDQEQVVGRTFKEAHCIFSVRSFPQGNGRVRVEITPEIEYGQPQIQYVGRQGRIDIQAGRQREIYSDLTCTTTLAPGQMLLFSTTPQPKGLGENMFTRETVSGPRRRFCMIQLVQTQYDDLFDKEKISAPIATSME